MVSSAVAATTGAEVIEVFIMADSPYKPNVRRLHGVISGISVAIFAVGGVMLADDLITSSACSISSQA